MLMTVSSIVRMMSIVLIGGMTIVIAIMVGYCEEGEGR